MCFQIDPAHPKRIKAKGHVLCYKKAGRKKDCCVSPYRRVIYHYGRIYKNIIKPSPDIRRRIYFGLHSFASDGWAGLGFLWAVIPKGAQYYRNDWPGEYVSNALIVFKSKRSMDVWLKRNKNKSLSNFKTYKLGKNA